MMECGRVKLKKVDTLMNAEKFTDKDCEHKNVKMTFRVYGPHRP